MLRILITEDQIKKLSKLLCEGDLEYYKVDDAHPESDEYDMGEGKRSLSRTRKKMMGMDDSRLVFDMKKLLDDGVIFITQGHDLTTGKRVPPEKDPETGEMYYDSTNLITFHNLIKPEKGTQDGIPEAVKHLRPDMIDHWQQTQNELVDDKYNQIIKSIDLKGKQLNDYTI